MTGGVTRHMLPHLSGVAHLHINRPWARLWFLSEFSHMSTWERFGRVFDLRKCSDVFDLRKVLVVCWTWECFWSCVRPENNFGNVFDLRKILVVCSPWARYWSSVRPDEDFWSCVRPKKDVGRMVYLVVCHLLLLYFLLCLFPFPPLSWPEG